MLDRLFTLRSQEHTGIYNTFMRDTLAQKCLRDGVSGLFTVSVFVWAIRHSAPLPATEEFSPEKTLAERDSQQHMTRKCVVKTRRQSDKEDHEPNQ